MTLEHRNPHHDKAEYLKRGLADAGIRTTFAAPTFNEFVVEFPADFETRYRKLLDRNIVAGLPLASYYPELSGHYLLCATETRSREDMDELIREVTS